MAPGEWRLNGDTHDLKIPGYTSSAKIVKPKYLKQSSGTQERPFLGNKDHIEYGYALQLRTK